MYDWLRKALQSSVSANVPTKLSEHYWVFSTYFDEEIASQKLLDAFDRRVPGSARVAYETYTAILDAVAVGRATLQARTTLAAEELDHRLSDLDGCLSLSLLIDHSGSMRGDKAQMAIVIAECAAQLALKLGVPFEVLGFTTVEWRGDPVRRLWANSGKIENPGRLCALRHIVYSNFATKRLPDLRAMFLPDVLKENIDGEAILWATDRARRVGANRHLLMVVSDGAPVDDSTLHRNRSDYLWDHVTSVMNDLQADRDFIVVGVGLDHDVSRIYPKSVKIRFFGEVERLFLPFLVDCIFEAAEN